MTEYSIEQTTQWVHEYWIGYCAYMIKHHSALFVAFQMNIHPPQRIGAGIGIMQGAIHSDEDYAEIMRITREFCLKYDNPIDFPKEF